MESFETHPSNDPLDVLRLLGHMYLRYERAQRALARAAILAGQTDEALRAIDQLRDEGDASPVLWLLEGQALASVGRKTEALAVLERFSRHRVHPQPRGVR